MRICVRMLESPGEQQWYMTTKRRACRFGEYDTDDATGTYGRTEPAGGCLGRALLPYSRGFGVANTTGARVAGLA
jgi:hypothetical protein